MKIPPTWTVWSIFSQNFPPAKITTFTVILITEPFQWYHTWTPYFKSILLSGLIEKIYLNLRVLCLYCVYIIMPLNSIEFIELHISLWFSNTCKRGRTTRQFSDCCDEPWWPYWLHGRPLPSTQDIHGQVVLAVYQGYLHTWTKTPQTGLITRTKTPKVGLILKTKKH